MTEAPTGEPRSSSVPVSPGVGVNIERPLGQIDVVQPGTPLGTPRRAYFLPGYDPKRTEEYVKREVDGNVVVTDPVTGEVVARLPMLAGRSPGNAAGNAEVGGGNGGNRGSEGSRTPEPDRGPEWETSPERGRWLCDEIIRFRKTMSYQERYNEVNGPVYAQQIKELQEYVDKLCEIRNDPDPFGPHKAYPKIQYRQEPGKPPEPYLEFPSEPQAMQEMNEMVNKFRARYQLEGAKEPDESEDFPKKSLPTISVDVRRTQYLSNPQDKDAQTDLQVYFQQAKNYGLLKEVDAMLILTYQEINRAGISSDQAEALLERGIARARRIASVEFSEISGDPDFPQQLAGVGEAYIDWAHRRLELRLHGRPQPEHRKGEWSVPTSEQRETFWETGSYPKYYHITARTPEQFLIAKETFFQMVRSGSIGKSPTAIFEHVKNFIEVFGSEGARQVREDNIDLDFLTANRLELEALLYVFVGDYSNNVYNPKQRKEAMMAMSLDEGPARWAALYRAGQGGIASFTQMFDMEALMDIYNNPVGERGELDIIAGHFLQDQIQEKVIERGMGIVLKDYDPRDEYFNSDDLQAKIAAAKDLKRIKEDLRKIENDINAGRIKLKKGETATSRLGGDNQVKREYDQARLNAYKANLHRLGLTKSDEEFKGLYEGFDEGDTHIKNYQRFKKDQGKLPAQRQFSSLDELPENIKKSIDLGRIQEEIQGFRQAIRSGQIKLERGQKAVDLLSPRDRQVYQSAHDEAVANFDIASQMQGVLAEKARRGRGFLYVDRNPHIRYYFEVGDQLRLQKEDINKLDPKLNPVEFDQLRASLPEHKRRSFAIGWMLAKMRDLKPLGSFPQGWQDFYNEQLSPEDKLDFVDNIPVYQAENFVQWGVLWTKMKYANASATVRKTKAEEARARLIEELRTKGYAAQLWDDFTLLRGGKPVVSNNIGYNKDGKLVSLSFNAEGVPVGIDFDDAGAVIFDKPQTDDQKHEVSDRKRIKFDNLDRNTKFPPRLMTFKRPLGVIDSDTGQFKKVKNGDVIGYNEVGQEIKLSLDQEGKFQGLQFDQGGKAIIYDRSDADDPDRKRTIYDNINVNTKAQLHVQTGIFVEEVVATFQIAAQSSDFRNRYTDHTYWYYQGNNRDTILTDHIREAAGRIKDGLSRWEDEDILATQLLIVDPTLKRVRKFEGANKERNQQAREVTLIAAAVLESFQGKQRTKHNLHRAFLPKDGFIGRMRAGYRNEDWAGMDRFTLGFEEFAAQQSLRLSRRLGAEIAIAPFEHDAAGPKWGVHGVSGAIKVMADEIKKLSQQGIVGQFGLTKVFEQLDKAVEMYYALVGTTDPQTGENVFGLFEKPTDNNETMHKYYKKSIAHQLLSDPEANIPFLYDFLKCFGRLTKVTHIMRVMYTNVDNAAGALDLEKMEVFLEDGSFNTAIETDKDILKNNGTARNRQNAFLHGEGGGRGIFDWLQDNSPGGGADVYKGEAYWNSFLNKKYAIYEGGEKATIDYQYVKTWLTDKII